MKCIFSLLALIASFTLFGLEQAQSPRIAHLKTEIEADAQAATERFVLELKARGTPLVEPIENDPDHYLVTFVWKGNKETSAVYLLGGITFMECSDSLMEQVPQSDFWVKTYKLEESLKSSYVFSVYDRNIKHVIDFKDPTTIVKFWKIDPYNKNYYAFHKVLDQDPLIKYSVFKLTSDKRTEPDFPSPLSGTVIKRNFKSLILGNERKISVYLPPGYNPKETRNYPTLIFFDGDAYLETMQVDKLLDVLISKKSIAPCIAFFIENANFQTRPTELPCHKPFADFLAFEFIPWAGKHFPLLEDPKSRLLCGFSFGGLASLYAAMKYPNLFGKVISQSAALWWHQENDPKHYLVEQYQKASKLPIEIFLNVGTYEVFSDDHDFLATHREFIKVLKEKGYSFKFQEFSGGHDLLYWKETLSEGLLFHMKPAKNHAT